MHRDVSRLCTPTILFALLVGCGNQTSNESQPESGLPGHASPGDASAPRADASTPPGQPVDASLPPVVDGPNTVDAPGWCQPEAYPATISTTSSGFVDGHGCPVTLDGFVIDAYWGSGTDTWQASTYQQIASAGFTAVRVWINWSDFEPTQGNFSSVAFQTLDAAVQSAHDAKLYVILCPIFINNNEERVPTWAQGGVNSIDDISENAAGYLKYVANHYLNDKTIAAYDLVNEPGGESLDDLLTMYATALADVRSVDATHPRSSRSYGGCASAPQQSDSGTWVTIGSTGGPSVMRASDEAMPSRWSRISTRRPPAPSGVIAPYVVNSSGRAPWMATRAASKTRPAQAHVHATGKVTSPVGIPRGGARLRRAMRSTMASGMASANAFAR